MLAVLFSALDADKRGRVISAVEECVRHDVCPAMAGLVGAGSSGQPHRLSGAWPVILPLAPYFESIPA